MIQIRDRIINAIQKKDITPYNLCILLAIASKCNKDKQRICFLEDLGKELNLRSCTIRYHLNSLVKKELVEVGIIKKRGVTKKVYTITTDLIERKKSKYLTSNKN
jgi:predicted ArsR family transcriptional regulator